MFSGLVLMTCCIHCVMGWKIWQKKVLSSQPSGAHQKQNIFIICHSQSQKTTNAASGFAKSSVLDNLSSVLFLFLLIVFIPVISVVFMLLGGLPVILAVRLAVLASFLTIMPVSVYIREGHVRTTLLRELKQMLP